MTQINWSAVLECTERGPRPTLTNAVRVLQRDPTLGPAQLWYDEFLDRVFTANSPTREWCDEDDYRLTVYLQEQTGMVNVPDSIVGKAVRMVAKQRTRHVVRDWLATLVWDRVERIAHAFEDHWGVEPSASLPEDYVRRASANFFIGLIARIYRPGCQFDSMVVFEGAQGIGKTSALRVLAGEPWYMLAHESVTKKDFFESMRGKWIIEIGELDAFSRAEVTRVKTVISTPTDRYRPSYGRATLDYPRQCIFAGTTNKDDWAVDETGLRRFWPMPCGQVNLPALAAARDQLFAEAVHRFTAGASWWTMPASAADVQAERQQTDEWALLVMPWCELQLTTGLDHVRIGDVLANGLRVSTSQADRSAQMRVARILRLNGWERRAIRTTTSSGISSTNKAWYPPQSDTFSS